MNFAEKKQAYLELQDTAQLEPDRELLKKKAPNASELQTVIIDKEKAQCEILWALLDLATVDEITANRPAPVKELTKEEIDLCKEKEATVQLIALDIESATQPVLAAIARTLKLTTPDFKAATLRPILKDLRDIKLLPTQSHSDQVIDQMNADKEELHGKVEELETEKEDLQEKLEEVEAEKNDLEEQLEDAESEKEDLEKQLEEEKKSEATPDPE